MSLSQDSQVYQIPLGDHRILHRGDRDKVVLLSSRTSAPHFTSCLSILVDGSFKPSTHSADIAFIVKNDQDSSLLRRAKIINAASAFQTEVLACLEAISFAVPNDFTHISVLTDCLLLVQCLTNDSLIPYFLINIFEDVRTLASYS